MTVRLPLLVPRAAYVTRQIDFAPSRHELALNAREMIAAGEAENWTKVWNTLELYPHWINRRDAAGNRLLHYAAAQDRNDQVVWLLQNQANARIANRCKETPLHIAAWNLNSLIIQILIDKSWGENAASVHDENGRHQMPLDCAYLSVDEKNQVIYDQLEQGKISCKDFDLAAETIRKAESAAKEWLNPQKDAQEKLKHCGARQEARYKMRLQLERNAAHIAGKMNFIF